MIGTAETRRTPRDAFGLEQNDPLPSWSDGASRRAIMEFIARVTRPNSPEFVRPAERVAVFDNDGTLWAEQPLCFHLRFALDRVRALAPDFPEWKTMQPFKAVLESDQPALTTAGMKGLLEIVAATHTGMTTDDFLTVIADWLSSERHPRFRCPYATLSYQPMAELLALLGKHEFRTFIVSSGGVEFMRVFAEQALGVTPDQVIGSCGVTKYIVPPGEKPVLLKETRIEFIDEGPGKPVGVHRFLGRRPIFAFGNSDGDQQMLQWVAAGPGARFMGLVHHTDAEREWAYDRDSAVGKLDRALDEARKRGWAVVDMKKDWRTIFAPSPEVPVRPTFAEPIKSELG